MINKDLKEVERKSQKGPSKIKTSKLTTPLTAREDMYSEESHADQMSPKMMNTDLTG